jgi:hypothetical protein
MASLQRCKARTANETDQEATELHQALDSALADWRARRTPRLQTQRARTPSSWQRERRRRDAWWWD